MHSHTHRRAAILSREATIARTRRPPQVGYGPLVLGQEPSDPSVRTIVAGFDGTATGEAAVAEAALTAGPSGCVFVVYAYRTPPSFLGWTSFDSAVSKARLAGRRVLDDLWRKRGELPTAEFIPELIAGPPADAISRVASVRHAEAIVVGAGHGRRFRVRRSVARQLQRTGGVPVIVVSPSRARVGSEGEPGVTREVVTPDVSTWW
jgi:nucleotide-binding universal stress UspA family protein